MITLCRMPAILFVALQLFSRNGVKKKEWEKGHAQSLLVPKYHRPRTQSHVVIPRFPPCLRFLDKDAQAWYSPRPSPPPTFT